MQAFMQFWMEDREKRDAEQAEIEAVFAAEEAAAASRLAGKDDRQEAAIDFTAWDSESFSDLVARVSAEKPLNAPRRSVDDGEFERAMARFAEVE